jgi:hypothetical protein
MGVDMKHGEAIEWIHTPKCKNCEHWDKREKYCRKRVCPYPDKGGKGHKT